MSAKNLYENYGVYTANSKNIPSIDESGNVKDTAANQSSNKLALSQIQEYNRTNKTLNSTPLFQTSSSQKHLGQVHFIRIDVKSEEN